MATGVSRAELRERLQGIDDYDFEYFVAELWEHHGYETTVTQASKDRGIDVVAEQSGPIDHTLLLQAKRYAAGNKIGSKEVQAYAGVLQRETDADAMALVTTSSFTEPAKREAEELGIHLYDGDELAEMVQEAAADALVTEHAPAPTGLGAVTSRVKQGLRGLSDGDDAATPGSTAHGLLSLLFYTQIAAVVLALFPSFLPAVTPNTAGAVFVVALLAAPVLAVADLRTLRRRDAVTVQWWAYAFWPVAVVFLPVVGLFWYLVARPSS